MHSRRHARACRGHPRLLTAALEGRRGCPGLRPAMTSGVPISSESGQRRRLESSESFLRPHPEGTSPSGASSPAFPTGKINSYFSIFFRKNTNQNNAAIIENRLVVETKYLSGRFGSMYPSNHVPTFQPTLQRRQRAPVLEHRRESAMLLRQGGCSVRCCISARSTVASMKPGAG